MDGAAPLTEFGQIPARLVTSSPSGAGSAHDTIVGLNWHPDENVHGLGMLESGNRVIW